jgi:hypothetical protein
MTHDTNKEVEKLTNDAQQKFEDLYPQQFCVVCRAAPPDISAGAGPDGWKNMKAAVADAMNVLQDTADQPEGFMLLLRRTHLASLATSDGTKVRISDHAIESVYWFKDNTWRHVWGFRLEKT